jgi:hypothetical protein
MGGGPTFFALTARLTLGARLSAGRASGLLVVMLHPQVARPAKLTTGASVSKRSATR